MPDILNALAHLTNFLFIPALTYGAQLSLGALGITLIYGILRFAHFAHGDMMSLGTAITILLTWQLQAWGISLSPFPTAFLALPFAIVAIAFIAIFIDRTIYAHYRRRRDKPIVFLMVSIGVMFMLGGIVRLLVGTGDQTFLDGARFLLTARESREVTGLREAIPIRQTQVITIITTSLLLAAVFWFLYRTRTGKAMRAYADNEALARLSGIDPRLITRLVWCIAAGLACVAGVLYGLDKSFRPYTYFQILLPMFSTAILGGIGSPIGAVVAGFIIAFSELIITFAWRRVAIYLAPDGFEPEGILQFLSTDYRLAIAFVMLVIILLVRPNGLFRSHAS